MHLAYLDPHPVPDSCPEALQMLYTVDALGSLGTRVTLVTPKPDSVTDARAILGHDISTNVQARHLESRRGLWRWLRSNQPFYRMAAATLKETKADAVLVRNLKMAEHLLRHAPNVPLFFETHELFAQSYREEHPRMNLRRHHKLAALAQREEFVYRNATGLVALTPLLVEDIRTTYRVETPATVAPDGVDLEQARTPVATTPHTTPGGAEVEQRREQLPTTPWLLYLGSLHPWKGVDTLVRAMAHVKQPAELHIVGGNAARIGELRMLADEFDVIRRVVFHGPVEPGRRFEYIHRADICLLPLTDTGLGGRYTSPLKLFEYMAAGKAIVVSDLPSMHQVLTPEQNALLVPSGEPEAFAQAIDRLLMDKALKTRLGDAAKSRAQNFSWRARSETILRFITTQLGRA
ncbi:MAG TPA: glycosyltransferase family 4 protein [Burkholderiales bacterium]|nr:glycosyltransferase family 4 protein [Burkholderiales bacterium]